MPFTVNGFGVGVYRGRGSVSWFGQESFDGMEFLCALFIPIVPIKAVHTYEWHGAEYRQLPIRRTGGLVLRCYWRSAAYLTIIAGLLVLALAAGGPFAKGDRPGQGAISVGVALGLAAAGLIVLGLGFLLLYLFNRSDERDRNIRRVMGPHFAGSSDPAYWTADMTSQIKSAQEAHGAPTYLHAAMNLFQQNLFAEAMMCARIAMAQGEVDQGDEMTTAILNQPEVIDGLRKVKAAPDTWPAVFGSAD